MEKKIKIFPFKEGVLKAETKLKEVEIKVTDKLLKQLLKKFAEDVLVQELKNRKNLENIMDAFAKIELHDTRVCDIVTNAKTYVFIRKMKNLFDVNTHAHLLKHGIMGHFFGARVWVTRSAKEDDVFVYGENEKSLKKDFPEIAKSKKILKLLD